MIAVALSRLAVSIDGHEIVRPTDLTVEAGEWVTVIGPNGAGKTTLLRAIGGLVPYSGSLSLFGRPALALKRRERARLLATVPQSPTVPPGMAVLDYVLLGRTPYIAPLGRESAADLAAVEEVLARLDLAGFGARRLESLSGGERQRAFLARALAQGAALFRGPALGPDQQGGVLRGPALGPDQQGGVLRGPALGPDQQGGLLLLDEPTTALDIGHQQDVLELVDQLRRDHGLTVLASMHDLSIAGEYADRMVLLAGGSVVASGPPRAVLTEENLSAHYRARVRVVDGVVIPIRPAR